MLSRIYQILPGMIGAAAACNTYPEPAKRKAGRSRLGVRCTARRSRSSLMHQLGNDKATPRKARGVVKIAAALLSAAVFCQPALVSAAPHGGGGGFHGGGF